MAEKLSAMRIIPTAQIEELAASLSCDPSVKACMYMECENCKHNAIEITAPYGPEELVKYLQWKTAADEKGYTITVKETKTQSMQEMLANFEQSMERFCRHIFNIRHQYKAYRLKCDSLQTDECIIHIDFAENYTCKYTKEIQAVHFGGSHKQVTMHTGVLYIHGSKALPFCTISDSRQHDPCGIWCYIQPVIQWIRTQYENVKRFHFFSDGPTSQYRQKKNFAMFLSFFSGTNSTWNFFETSHGKGAADGVGGVLKRTADQIVKQGTDLPDPRSVYEELVPLTTVKLFFVPTKEVENFTNKISDVRLPPVPGMFSAL